MPGKTLIAALAGFGAGITLALAADQGLGTDDAPALALLTATTFFPMSVVSVIALTVHRRHDQRQAERNRRDLEVISEQRHMLREDFEHRSAGLRDRQARLNDQADTERQQIARILQQLGEAREEAASERMAREQLEKDYDVLASEYNGMILGSVQERADAFTRRPRPVPWAPIPRPSGRRRERHRERSSDNDSVARLYVDSPSLTDADQHSRPVEG